MVSDRSRKVHSLLVLICAIIAPNLLVVQFGFSGDVVSLSYHRSVDQRVYDKEPRKHERLEYGGKGNSRLYFYVELNPTRQILAKEIEAVIVKKQRKFGYTPDEVKAFEEAVKKSFKIGSPQADATSEKYPLGFTYSITFKLTLPEWKREVAFTNKHLGHQFQLRLGKQDLGLVDFVVPFEVDESREFTIYTHEDDASLLSKMLSPLKEKIRWK